MTSREQFECAFEEVKDDRFVSNIDFAWKFWQASRAAIEIDLSNMHLLLCDQNDVVDELIKHGIKSKVNP